MDDTNESLCVLSKRNRIIRIAGDISYETLLHFRRQLAILEDASEEPVIVELNSEGGHVESGLAIVDTIQLSPLWITTRVTGTAYSMASVILVAGDLREALPNSRIMLHEASVAVNNRVSVVQRDYEEALAVDAITWSMMDKRSNKPDGFWKNRCNNTNLYLSSHQALELGLIDRICAQ